MLVVLWMGFMARTNTYSSAKTQLRRLRAWYRTWKRTRHADFMESHLLESFLLGLRRTNGGAPQRKRPITPEMLLAFAAVVDNADSADLEIVFFAILIGFFCFLRKSNLTTESETLYDSSKLMRRSDIRVDREAYVLWVRIRRTKTMQYGDRELWLPVHGARGHTLDVIARFDRVFATYPHLGMGEHIFSGMHGTGSTIRPLQYHHFISELKKLVTKIGLDPTNVAGHSLRRGGASYAFHCGVPSEVIKQQGDWHSDCYLLYCVIPPSQLLASTSKMFEGIYDGRLGGEIWSASARD